MLVVLLDAGASVNQSFVYNSQKLTVAQYTYQYGHPEHLEKAQQLSARVREEAVKQLELNRRRQEEERRRQEEERRLQEEERRVVEERHLQLAVLHIAVETNDSAKARSILASDPSRATYNDALRGQMPIHVAAGRGITAMVELLLPATGVEALSTAGRTPLHEAAHGGHIDVAQILLLHDANVNALTTAEETPALLACANGKYDMLKLLAGACANLSLCNARKKDVYDLLREQRRPDVVTELLNIFSRQNYEVALQRELASWMGIRPHLQLVERAPDTQADAIAAVERVCRAGRGEGVFDVINDTFFLADGNHPDSALYRALAFASMGEFTWHDVSNELSAYEKPGGPKSVLLMLAHARLLHRRNMAEQQQALLREFSKHASQQLQQRWLTDRERALIARVVREKTVPSTTPKTQLELDFDVLMQSLTAEERKPLDELMRMVGLDEVKRLALSLFRDNLADKRLRAAGFQASVEPRTLNFCFMGNPGTGKTVTAELFAQLLHQSGARAAYKFIKMTAAEALRKGAKQFAAELAVLTGGRKGVGPDAGAVLRKGMSVQVHDNEKRLFPAKVASVDAAKNEYAVDYADGTTEEGVPRARVVAIGEDKNVGGVLFLDEAYDLDPKTITEGRAIINEIMSVAEEFRDTVTIILAGYRNEIESKLIAFNPGMAARFTSVTFEDFTEPQLADVWRKLCKDRDYVSDESVTCVASRRVARGIGQHSFANARAVRVLFQTAASSAKMHFTGRKGEKPTVLVTDVIGLEPTRDNIPELDAALHELERLTGLGNVKRAVQQLVDVARANYDKELRGEQVDAIAFNRLFIGNPGTGKTTVAKIYGRILRSLRLLSNGEVLLKTPSDFVGAHVGESQSKTRAILDTAQGKIVLLDECYVLDDGLYGKQVLDTIVERLDNKPGADICMIMAGYKAPVLKMLRDQNPGLSSRFSPENAIEFDDYSDSELLRILALEVQSTKVEMPVRVKLHAVKSLARRRAMANFGNARNVTTLLSNAKLRFETRKIASAAGEKPTEFSIDDVDPDVMDQVR